MQRRLIQSRINDSCLRLETPEHVFYLLNYCFVVNSDFSFDEVNNAIHFMLVDFSQAVRYFLKVQNEK